MFRFHYNYMLKKYGPERLALLFTDIDSLTYHMLTEDFFRDITPDVYEHFDTNEYPKDGHESGIPAGVNTKVPGMMKDEFHGKPVVSFRGLRAKCYAFKSEEFCEKRAKGVGKRIVSSKVGFEHYDNCLRENKVYNTQFVNLRSTGHKITTDLIRKEVLYAFDDKRYLLRDGTHRTLAWFHKKYPESERELCDASERVKTVSTELCW